MNLFALAGLSVGISCLMLFILIWIFGKTKLHRALQFFNFVVALWGFGLFFVGLSESEPNALSAWRMAHWGGFLISPTYYYFISVFCDIRRRKSLYFAYLQAGVLIVLGLIPGLVFRNTRYVYKLYYLEPTVLYTVAVGLRPISGFSCGPL